MITSFNPQIITKDAEAVVRLFEALGFERRHIKEDIGDLSVTGIRMKDENGFYLDISESDQLPVDCIEAIRMNVDNFDEAYRLLEDHGFKKLLRRPRGGKPHLHIRHDDRSLRLRCQSGAAYPEMSF